MEGITMKGITLKGKLKLLDRAIPKIKDIFNKEPKTPTDYLIIVLISHAVLYRTLNFDLENALLDIQNLTSEKDYILSNLRKLRDLDIDVVIEKLFLYDLI